MRELSFNLERSIAPAPIVLEELEATENGTYLPSEGVNGFSRVTVNTPITPPAVLTTLSVSENGTYTPEQGVDGFSEVEVSVPAGKATVSGDISDGFKNANIWSAISPHIEFGEITRMDSAFIYNSALTELTVSITNLSYMFASTFNYCGLRHAPTFIVNNELGYKEVSGLNFSGCYYLQDCNLPTVRPSSNQRIDYMFGHCYRLRSVDSTFLSQIQNGGEDYYGGFQECYSIDEIHNYPLISGSSTFLADCYRLKSFTFYNDGTAQRVGNKTVKMNGSKGYIRNGSRDTFLANTDFTTDTEITDATTYAALKNNPDYWTADVAYSRYNRASAAETLNSLPENIYLSPIIQFTGNSGSATDEGAINTLTAEEIAVATTKGWTVSYV